MNVYDFQHLTSRFFTINLNNNYFLIKITDTVLCPKCSAFFFFKKKGPNPQHMEVPILGVESELQVPAYATITTTSDPGHVYDLHQSAAQCWILNPLSEARDRTHILMDSSLFHYH